MAVSARATASNLRTQGVVIRWSCPLALGLAAVGAGAQVSATVGFVGALLAVPLGLLAGFWTAAWFDAAAEALECEHAILDALHGVGNTLAQLSAAQRTKTLETLRMLGEHMVNGNGRNTDLLRTIAENTDSLTRLEPTEEAANVNRG
jgi:hypothetical protein